MVQSPPYKQDWNHIYKYNTWFYVILLLKYLQHIHKEKNLINAQNVQLYKLSPPSLQYESLV